MANFRYFLKHDSKERNLEFPSSLVVNPKYKNMSNYSKLIWPFLLDLQKTLPMKYDQQGRVYLRELPLYVKNVLDISDNEAASILKEMETYDLLEIATVNHDVFERYYLLKPEYAVDLMELKRQFHRDVQIAIKKANDRIVIRGERKEHALSYMDNHPLIDVRLLTDDAKLVLYQNIKSVELLLNHGLFSLDDLLEIKKQSRLSAKVFAEFLEKALDLYDYNPSNGKRIHFNHFFTSLLNDADQLMKEKEIMDAITEKMQDLPNNLKMFVYKFLIKQSEQHPDRFEQIINELRVINMLYSEQEPGVFTDEMFKKAFSNLFQSDKTIHSVAGYFSKGIQYILEDNKSKNQVIHTEEQYTGSKGTQEKKHSHFQDIDSDISKLSPEEKEAYFKEIEEAKNMLKQLKRK